MIIQKTVRLKKKEFNKGRNDRYHAVMLYVTWWLFGIFPLYRRETIQSHNL